MATNPQETFVIPTVGMSGYYSLREPFAAKMPGNVRFTCQAVRRISDYVANNEDVKADVYTANQIADDVWEEDLAADAYILSLQGETGQWMYVPVRYNIEYPNTNGVPYRTLSLAVQLPALPVNRDYSDLNVAIQNLIRDTLGVNSKIEMVETSKVTLVDPVKHQTIDEARMAIAGAANTDRSRYQRKVTELDQANQVISDLQDYILNHQ